MTKTTPKDFRDQLMTEGVPSAYSALMRVLQDKNASATALASAARTMLDIAGLTKSPDGEKSKEPHEMTADELAEFLRRGEERLSDLRQEPRGDEGQVFD